MSSLSHLRLWLYIAIGTLPGAIEWIVLTWDVSPRGLFILLFKSLLGACITMRAYIDTGKPPEEPKSIPVLVLPQPPPTPQ